jgi:putative phosphoesterase
VRIGVIADVHCQHEPLRAVAEALMSQAVDEIVLAGDAHYEYRFSNEVMEVIREFGMRYVLGNHEAMLLGPHGARAASAPHVRRQNLTHLQQTPAHLRVQVGGKTVSVFHANPWALDNKYLYEGDPMFQRCDELDTDYLILGHTHVPMSARYGRTLVVNPGSLAFSRDPGGNGTITYGVLDTGTDEVHLVRQSRSVVSRPSAM